MTPTCPSLLDLYSADGHVREHVAGCPRCQALKDSVPSHDPPPSSALEFSPGSGADPRRGSVWTLAAPHTDTFLFVTVLHFDEVEAWVAPAADDIPPLGTDFLLDDTTLGYTMWIRCSAAFTVLREQLQDELGRLTEEETDTVMSCVVAVREGEDFTGDDRFGVPVLVDYDPRLDAADDWKQSITPWRQPWELLSVAEELGAVCAARRQQLGISVSELADDVDIDLEAWTRFEAAQLDLPALLPTARLAAAIRKLSLPVGRKLLKLVAASVTLTHLPQTASPAALARRRQGVRQTTGRADPDEVRKAADRYAAALGRSLGL